MDLRCHLGCCSTIGDAPATVAQGTSPRQAPVNLYFDVSGFLVRMVRFSDTLVGRVPTQIDFSDHRDVSGVKLPFQWTTTSTANEITTAVTGIQSNVAIDDNQFAQPPPAGEPRKR